MAITYSIAPNPHWVIIDNFSKLPPGAAIYTYSSLDPSQFKPAFQDAGGSIPYGQPIVGFDNGTFPPIFWQFDSANPNDLYYIRVYDSFNTTTQQFLWDYNGITGGSSGGGGTVTVNNDIQNLVTNGQFYRNIGTIAGTPSIPLFNTLAPSNNAGYVGNPVDKVFSLGQAAPDIIFTKSNATATDTITFPTVPASNPPGIASLAPNPTPAQYFHYACTGAGSGETYKFLQIPIAQGLQGLSGQTISIKLYARLNSGANLVTLTLRQYFGDGGSPSIDVPTLIGGGPLSLTTNWQGFIFNGIVIPGIGGKTLGTCGNDALFLQVNMPLSPSLVDFDCVLPSVYLVSALSASAIDYKTNDQTDSIIALPRTGDVRISLNGFVPYGWVAMNDGTIGSAASGSSNRANIDTFPLFNLLWRAFQATPTLAPMLTSAGAPVAYGADPFTDFNANRRLTLTAQAGRVIAGVSVSPAHALGTIVGAETHILIPSELPDPLTTSAQNFSAAAGGGAAVIQSQTSHGTGSVSNLGGGTAMSLMQPTVYNNIYVKL